LLPEIRRAIQSVHPVQPIHDIATMPEIVEDSLSLERVSSFMTGFFALAALLMATLGIYGIVAYWVRQRRVEIGTRMALGAVGRDLFALVIGGGMKMAGWGIGFGGVAVAVTTWLLIRDFGIRDIGALSFLYSIAIVAALAVAASFFPAFQATLLSPMVAIRDEPGAMWRNAQRSFRSGVSHLISRGNPEEVPEAILLSEFVEAARRAESFSEALHIALASLCENIGSESAMLLEKDSPEGYRRVAAVPQTTNSQLALPANGFLLNRLKSYPAPLPLMQADFEAWERWAAEQRPHYLAEIQALKQTETRLAVALRAKKDIVGVLLLGPPIGRSEFTVIQKRILRACAEQFALMIENARLTDRIVEQEKLRRDLALAAEVQKRLLPETSPETSLGTLAAISVPARTVGGDYFDFLDVGNHRIGIALADIAGKGVAAALIMSVVHASLRIIAAEGSVSLPDLAAKMNRFLYRSTRSSSYATFFYAQVDEESRQLRYVNAGHNPPYLLRSADPDSGSTLQIDELSTGGMIIGMFPQVSYEEATVDLRTGDVLIVFTDGVTEALNPEGEEFGETRLKELLRSVAHLAVEEMSSKISQELKTWISHAEQHDDLTFIVMKVS
jgi:serine phosphatase RsbU (regulator of sigma subunit)